MLKTRPQWSALCCSLRAARRAQHAGGCSGQNPALPLLHSVVTDSIMWEDGSAGPGILKALKGGCCDYYLTPSLILSLKLQLEWIIPSGPNTSSLHSFRSLWVCWFHSRKLLHFISTRAILFPHSPSIQILVIFLGLFVWVSGPSLGRVSQRPQEIPPPCEYLPHVCLFISLCLQVRAEMSIPSLEHEV